MSEYIDKDVMREILTKELNSTLVFEKDDLGFRNALQFAIDRLNKIFPADVAPVVHGQWIKVKGTVGWYESCSICGSGAERQGYNFCPRCGAKMDESEGKDYERTIL